MWHQRSLCKQCQEGLDIGLEYPMVEKIVYISIHTRIHAVKDKNFVVCLFFFLHTSCIQL